MDGTYCGVCGMGLMDDGGCPKHAFERIVSEVRAKAAKNIQIEADRKILKEFGL